MIRLLRCGAAGGTISRMKKLLKVAGSLLLLLYVAMCFMAKMDGGARKAMPSGSADEASRAGMLVKRLTLITDSGGPAHISEAWIEISAVTDYQFGVLPYRKPLHYLDADSIHYLLAVLVPGGTHLGENRTGTSGKAHALPDGREVQAFDIVPPLPDTIHLQAKRPGESGYPVVFADGRSARDAAPKRGY